MADVSAIETSGSPRGNQNADSGRSSVRPRWPLHSITLSYCAGILIDRWFGFDWIVWLAICPAAAIATAILTIRRSAGPATAMLLVFWAGLGGARHHQFWSVCPESEISRFASDTLRPVSVTGRIATRPSIRPRGDRPSGGREDPVDVTTCLMDCTALETDVGNRPVSGRIRLSVAGHLSGREVGDRVRVHGTMFPVRPPTNPGAFDFRAFLRRRGARCLVHTNHPDGVERVTPGPRWHPRRLIAALREQAGFVVAHHVDEDVLPTAMAILLGNRDLMTDESRDTFMRSGTMHVLAISGLHVGILAGFLLVMCRALSMSRTTSLLFVLTGIGSYALITDVRPSVVRAAILIVVLLGGRSVYRRASFLNTLSVAALALLLWNPTDLFDTGARLSFLAVTAIAWTQSGLWLNRRDADDAAIPVTASIGRRISVRGVRWLVRSYATMGGVAVFTFPLVAQAFNLVSPVGLIVNVALIPAVIGVLWCGYALLFTGLLTPWIAPLFGLLFGTGLQWIERIVDACAENRFGHLYVPDIPQWWLIGYYVCIGAAIALSPPGRRITRPLTAAFVWTAVGLGTALATPQPESLRCTFLDVGHGNAVLISTPGGRNLLVDAGSIDNELRAQRVVQSALWHGGATRLDAVCVTHADTDHFNGLAGLFETVLVGRMVITESFRDSDQANAQHVLQVAKEHGVPVDIAGEGDTIDVEPGVRFQVLHPPRSPVPHPDTRESDNELSLVLLVEYAGRRILLPGDIEGRGLDRLLDGPPVDVDVLMSPHHGSPAANPVQLAEWARPDEVVASTDKESVQQKLADRFGSETRVVTTAVQGAITFEISPDGQIRRFTWLDGGKQQDPELSF